MDSRDLQQGDEMHCPHCRTWHPLIREAHRGHRRNNPDAVLRVSRVAVLRGLRGCGQQARDSEVSTERIAMDVLKGLSSTVQEGKMADQLRVMQIDKRATQLYVSSDSDNHGDGQWNGSVFRGEKWIAIPDQYFYLNHSVHETTKANDVAG